MLHGGLVALEEGLLGGNLGRERGRNGLGLDQLLEHRDFFQLHIGGALAELDVVHAQAGASTACAKGCHFDGLRLVLVFRHRFGTLRGVEVVYKADLFACRGSCVLTILDTNDSIFRESPDLSDAKGRDLVRVAVLELGELEVGPKNFKSAELWDQFFDALRATFEGRGSMLILGNNRNEDLGSGESGQLVGFLNDALLALVKAKLTKSD